jgi:isopropylmalate/homocitrate/citramalate synthase
MMNAATIMRYTRIWDRQIEIKQNRMKEKLMNRIKQVVQMNVDISLQSMQFVIDFFCIDVDDLKSKDEIDRSINYHRWFQSDYCLKSFLFY